MSLPSEPPPVAELIGLELLSAGDGASEFVLEAARRHTNPMGTVHGGILCDLADAAMGVAFASTLEDGQTFTTIELKINFLRPVWEGRLTGHGRVVSRGRTVGLTECDVLDADGRLVARATSTCMALSGDASTRR